MVFSDATQFFWQGISPYTTDFVEFHGRFFLYSPVFTVLFAPFAYLPAWLGPFAWNLFNYSLFFLAIFTLPRQFTHQQKCRMFLFLLLILGQSLLSFQYNITVACMFLFAYTLLEKDRGFLAVLLIMISGCTKVYGIFELALLLCYPHFWRNLGYAVGTGIVLLALPLIKIAPIDLFPYYEEWCHSLAVHQSTGAYDSFFYARPIAAWTLPHFRTLQLGMLGLLTLLFLGNFRKWPSFTFRTQALGILMGWVVLLSDSAEKHTYIIALAGFMLWYWSRTTRTMTDKILFWSCFALLCVVPIDLFVPVPVRTFITRTLWLHVWVFFIVWIRMIWLTFMVSLIHPPATDALSD
ncbi:glycosyltransferase family 87 protein [Bacteroides faecis]|uniref:glycosyltransferase family 87 protein n=2 Tax=Bacteroides TaxID=816 RepID=UPI0039C2C529